MKRFQRPVNEYTGAEELLYRDKYQQDSNSVPKIAISSSKMDGDFNYLMDAVNTLDEDIKSVVYSGIANETILEEHISASSVSYSKLANDAVSSRAIAAGAVTNAKLADLAVTTPKLANNSVTKDKISYASVGTDELIDGAITKDKLAADAISDSVPVGTIAQFSAEVLPTGWILCSGATVSKNTYPQLVKFLTGTDTTLEAVIPTIAEVDGVKYAIKAFSDVAELATLDIAGLTQDVADSAALIANKADKFAESIATAEISSTGGIIYSENIKSVSKIATGKYRIYLDDSLKGKSFDVLSNSRGFGPSRPMAINYANATFEVWTISTSNRSYEDSSFVAKVFPRKGEV
tara:strand:+ start:11632 stop:12678 length:1047 start_codon:yes stop_codon:yes gene_type:complete